VSTVAEVADPLDRLSPAARARLSRFSGELERLRIDDLPLYAVRVRQPDHRRAVEQAALVAREGGLDAVVEAARSAIIEYVARQHAASGPRLAFQFEAGGPTARPEDLVRVMRSVGDAVVAIVLWDRLTDWDRMELLGEWSRLLP
jgi:hypothetical protein